MRLDQYLVYYKLYATRGRAQEAIKQGLVTIDGEVSRSVSKRVSSDARVEVSSCSVPVGRGALKLDSALELLQVSVDGARCLDVGASTGGFTEVLLSRGARHVFAIDVGRDQLVDSLKSDSRVSCHEGINARHPFDLPERVDFLVVDVSFISLREVLSSSLSHLRRNGRALLLFKPQFELQHLKRNKRGVIVDEAACKEAVVLFEDFLRAKEMLVHRSFPCALKGKKGNQEWWVYCQKAS